jgi:uncharacterized protein (TIGR02449 family)
MNDKTSNNIEALESKVEELLELASRLSVENTTLKQQLQGLKVDRSGLVEQKEQVRTQVEGMIARLKAMESA